MAKRMRLPNGFGQISKISSKRLRKPYRVIVSVGTNPDTGHVISKLLKPEAYFATYNEAYAALLKYHSSPEIVEGEITLFELHEEWFKDYSITPEVKC